MTRAFLPLKTYENRVMALLSSHIEKDKLDKFFNRAADENLKVAFRFVRFQAPKIEEFHKFLTQGFEACGIKFNAEYIKGIPLIVPSRNYANFIVFPNIKLSRYDTSSLSQCSHLLFPEVLEDFIKEYKEDVAHEHKGKRWATLSRAWGAIKRNEEMPTARVLARFLNINGKLRDDQVQAIATAIEEQRKPMELIYAENDADIIRMYSSGPSSCMSVKGADARGWASIVTEQKTHPCAFLQHHPHIQGCFAVRGKDVVARTFIYKGEKKTWHGRVFGSNPKFIEQFTNSLKALGMELLPKKYDRLTEFTIPGYKHGADYLMPIPYCDNLADSIKVDWDADKKEFKVTTGGSSKSNVPYQSTQGFVLATHLKGIKCYHCKRVLAQGDFVTAIDGHSFCGSTCYRHLGYVYAYRSDGHRVVCPKDENVVIAADVGYHYTNVAAAAAMGVYPSLETLDDEDDPDLYWASGYVIKRGADLFRFRETDLNREIVRGCQTTRDARGNCVYIIPEVTVAPHIAIKYQRVVEIEEDHQFLAVA